MSEQNSEPSPFVPPAAPPERPTVPRYGEYAPNPYGVPTPPLAPNSPAPPYADAVAPARTRRTWDVVLTIILLVVGLIGMVLGILYAAVFSNPNVLRQALERQGIDGVTVNAGSAPALLIASQLVLFVVAAALSIALLIRGRVVVFWIPLLAGVIAAIIFWVTLVGILLSNPTIAQHYGG